MRGATVTASGARRLGFGPALGIQLRLLWQSRRPLFLLTALLAVLTLAGPPWNDDPTLMRLLAPWWIWLVVIGPIWGFAVWSKEGPSDRLYHWSQPVARPVHTLARVAAGGLWLLAAYAALIGLGLVFGLLDGNAGQLAGISPAGWVNLFAAPVMGYLGICVLSVLVDRPLIWFLGILVGVGLALSLIAEWVGEELVETLLVPLGLQETTWGLAPTLLAPLGIDASRIVAEARGTGAVSAGGFDIATWWLAVPLWLALFAILVAFAATRHPDRLPRWPRGR